MQTLYETEYGIYNHFAKNKSPLSLVAMHPAEDINDGSLLEEVIRMYTIKRIYDTFHLSLLEFLDLPIDIVQMLYTIADEEDAKKSSELSKLESSMKT